MIITWNYENEIQRTKNHLGRNFKIKNLGALKYFLGMGVFRTKASILINQRKYTLYLLKETRLINCRPTNTLIESYLRRHYKVEEILTDKGRFQRLIGKLIYLSHTHPNISQAVSF